MIFRQVRHMSRLVEDLLDATRVSRGTLVLRKESVNLADVVARAVEDVRPMMDARGHELVISMSEEPIVLLADSTRLEQVLANLLTNAAKYTDPGGRVELIALRERDEAVIRVRDTGIGLAPRPSSGCSSSSARWTRPTTAAAAGWGSGWRWSRAWWSCTAARSGPPATARAAAASSPSGCRSTGTRKTRGLGARNTEGLGK